MKRSHKPVLALLLALSLVLTALPHSAVALSVQKFLPVHHAVTDTKSQPEIIKPLGKEEFLADYDAAGAALRQGLKNREESVIVLFEADPSLDYYDIFMDISLAAFAHTGNPTEGDYLAVHLDDIMSESTYDPTTQLRQYKIQYTVEYFSTAQQEAQVDAAVSELLQSLSLDGKTDYEKIHAVYLWMCENIAYEERNEEEDYSLYEAKNTAYAAIIQRRTGSVGFAVLFYRLMLELGIDCRIVDGYIDYKAWNMVQLEGKCYFVDASEGARNFQYEEHYGSFLRVSSNYTWGHLFNRYDGTAFPYAYQVSETDYPLSVTECSHVYGESSCTGCYFHRNTCTLCGYVQVLYHTYEAASLDQQNHQLTCTQCGYSMQNAHQWDTGVIAQYPTPESAGTLRYACAVCAAVRDEELPSLGIGYEDIPEGENVIAGNRFFMELKWRLSDDGKLTIFGYGEMVNCHHWYRDADEWYAYKDQIRSIVIEDGVLVVGGDAFRELENLWMVTIGDSVTTICSDAFRGCPKLTNVILGSGLTTICDEAFAETENLWHVLYTGSEDQWDAVSVEYGNWNVSFPAHYNCDGDEITGLEDWTCAICSCNHEYDAGVVKAPTCVDRGYTTYTCALCQNSFRSNYTDIISHTFTAEVTVQPDHENYGQKVYTCTFCAYSYTELLPRLESPAEQTPAISDNHNGYDYINAGRWTTPIDSYLVWENGGYTRVEAIGDVLTVERYDEALQFVSRRDIPLELPLFGGVYLCEDYNFVVVGQYNDEEDNDKEVFRIIRYTKDWVRDGAVSLRGANTVEPFASGSLRFARIENTLYIRTSHRMYKAYDGLNHQANVTLCIDIPSMEIASQFTHVLNYKYGYVSHSFNQFIVADGTDIIALDHGDALPRSIILFRYDGSAGPLDFDRYIPSVEVLKIAESTGHYNDTGVSLGGLACSDTHYLVAGHSASQTGGTDFWYDQRNIFITATPKDDFSDDATTITWITHYQEGDDVTLGTPHFIKLEDGRFFLMWAVDGRINCCFITSDGQLEGDVFDVEGSLSDCAPLQMGDQLIWYVTKNSTPVFYSVDIRNPGQVIQPHAHNYVIEEVEPTCTQNGWKHCVCTECGLSYTEEYPATGHYYSETVVQPTCDEQGYTSHYCWRCDYSYADNYTEPTGHNYTQAVMEPSCTSDGVCFYYCPKCSDSYSEVLPALGHSYSETVTEPSCTESGECTYQCERCSRSYTEELPPLGHDFVDGECTRCGAADALIGDVNGDGRINARDARALLRYIAGMVNASEIDLAAADFNGDGRINARDARAILRHIAGMS